MPSFLKRLNEKLFGLLMEVLDEPRTIPVIAWGLILALLYYALNPGGSE